MRVSKQLLNAGEKEFQWLPFSEFVWGILCKHTDLVLKLKQTSANGEQAKPWMHEI